MVLKPTNIEAIESEPVATEVVKQVNANIRYLTIDTHNKLMKEVGTPLELRTGTDAKGDLKKFHDAISSKLTTEQKAEVGEKVLTRINRMYVDPATPHDEYDLSKSIEDLRKATELAQKPLAERRPGLTKFVKYSSFAGACSAIAGATWLASDALGAVGSQIATNFPLIGQTGSALWGAANGIAEYTGLSVLPSVSVPFSAPLTVPTGPIIAGIGALGGIGYLKRSILRTLGYEVPPYKTIHGAMAGNVWEGVKLPFEVIGLGGRAVGYSAKKTWNAVKATGRWAGRQVGAGWNTVKPTPLGIGGLFAGILLAAPMTGGSSVFWGAGAYLAGNIYSRLKDKKGFYNPRSVERSAIAAAHAA